MSQENVSEIKRSSFFIINCSVSEIQIVCNLYRFGSHICPSFYFLIYFLLIYLKCDIILDKNSYINFQFIRESNESNTPSPPPFSLDYLRVDWPSISAG